MTQFPKIEISSRHIRAKLYLPDQGKGYYRATRFDRSGIIFSMEYNGHQFSGPWFDKDDFQRFSLYQLVNPGTWEIMQEDNLLGLKDTVGFDKKKNPAGF